MTTSLESISKTVARRSVLSGLGKTIASIGIGLAGATYLERQAALATSCPCCWTQNHTGSNCSGIGCSCPCIGFNCSNYGASGCTCPNSWSAVCSWYCCLALPPGGVSGTIYKCFDCWDSSGYKCTLYSCTAGVTCGCSQCVS